MNLDHFHNQLALRLGYDRMLNNKLIAIMVDYKNPDDPRIELELPEGVKLSFNASEDAIVVNDRLKQTDVLNIINAYQIKQDITTIFDAAHKSAMDSINAFS